MNNKRGIISLIIILTILCISLIATMVYLMTNSVDFNFGFVLNPKDLVLVDSYESSDEEEINGIKFSLYSTDIDIKESENSNIKVEYFSSKEKNDKLEVKDNKISLKEEKNKTICFGICQNQRKIIVYIPNASSLTFDIKTRSGDIKSFVDLAESIVNITTTSGDIILENTTNVNLTTTSGDIVINNTNEANLVSTSGDIAVNEGDILNIVSTSGNILINTVTDTLNITSTSGDIKITNLEIVTDSNINTTSGDIKISNNNSNCYIDFKTKSGDNDINKSNRKSDIALNVSTTSGDISVN